MHPVLPAATPLLADGDTAVQVGGVDSTDGMLVMPADGRVTALLRAARREPGAADRAGRRRPGGPRPGDRHRSARRAARARGWSSTSTPPTCSRPTAGPAAADTHRRRTARTADRARAAPGRGRRRGRDPGRHAAGRRAGRERGRPGEHPRHRPRRGRATPSSGACTAADEGRPRSLAAADAVRRASPLTDLRPLPGGGVARSRRARPRLGGVGSRWSPASTAPACRTWWRPCGARRASSARWCCPGGPAACGAPTCTGATPIRAGPGWRHSSPRTSHHRAARR